MTAKLTASLRGAPATVPALAAIALCVVWATDQAGYPLTHWAPGGIALLALLVIAVIAVRRPLAGASGAVRLSLAMLAAYTAFSYLTILWAGAPGEALEGSDRTLLYLIVFALFVSWRQRGASAALVLGAWTLSLAGLGLFVILHLLAAGSGALPGLLPEGRLLYPTGYPNANAAEWLMAAWPALLLARERRLPWALRGLLAGSAVLLAEVALLSQSRGSLYATPVMVVLVLALLPGRTRTFATLIPVVAGVAAAAPAVLKVGNHTRHGVVVESNLHAACVATLLAALVVALVVAAASAVESRRTLPQERARAVHRATAAVGLAALLIVLAGGLAAAGNPVHRVEKAWHSFKGGYGEGGSDRLVSGLGSSRYDFFRVALDEFDAHPVGGIGVDNFQQQYLRKGRSNETPRYPHSVELRTLAETGVVGALLALAGLGAALLAAWRAVRGPDPLGRAVAAAALAGFGYWVVHGSFDWFWEFAGLGAPAFALLGLVCSLDPGRNERPAGAREPSRVPWRVPGGRRLRAVAGVCAAALVLGAAVAFAGPWLSQLQIQSAARRWPTDSAGAFSRLRQAATLDPFSDQAYLVAGSIALRLGELPQADAQFAKALGRVPDDAYATLERGAIASTEGRQSEARTLLKRAAELNPRDPLAQEALELVIHGRRVSVQSLNRLILERARQLA